MPFLTPEQEGVLGRLLDAGLVVVIVHVDLYFLESRVFTFLLIFIRGEGGGGEER
jgi:hypothetical protein